jgi:hypothetical protein
MDVHTPLCERRGEVSGYVDEWEREGGEIVRIRKRERDKAEERERVHRGTTAESNVCVCERERERESKRRERARETKRNAITHYFILVGVVTL